MTKWLDIITAIRKAIQHAAEIERLLPASPAPAVEPVAGEEGHVAPPVTAASKVQELQATLQSLHAAAMEKPEAQQAVAAAGGTTVHETRHATKKAAKKAATRDSGTRRRRS